STNWRLTSSRVIVRSSLACGEAGAGPRRVTHPSRPGSIRVPVTWGGVHGDPDLAFTGPPRGEYLFTQDISSGDAPDLRDSGRLYPPAPPGSTARRRIQRCGPGKSSGREALSRKRRRWAAGRLRLSGRAPGNLATPPRAEFLPAACT